VIVLSHPKDSSPMNGGEPTPWGSRTLTPVPEVGVRPAACARRSSKIPDSRLADDPEGATSAKTEKFIRNSSGIHPEFIRQSASSVLILRASGGKDSTECSRRGPLGKQLGAQRSSTDREEVAIKGTPGARTPTDPGVGRGRLGGYCTNPSSARLEEPMPSLTADGTVHTNY
jgi:hypothetical protein